MTTSTPQEYTLKDGSITTGGTAQPAIAANVNRRGFWLQNLSTENLYINDLGTAHATDGSSITVLPGAILSTKPGDEVSKAAISIIGATTGSKFTGREW